MTRTDFRGARGANAGDDYHELWALRESLALLDPETSLAAITLEGVHPDDERETTLDAWDGVDCAYYFGGDTLATASEVRIDQIKYSSSDPEKPWTVARLTAAPSRGRARRSVLGRLGEAFEAVRERRPDLIATGKVTIRLVSNQPLACEVTQVLSVVVPEPSTASTPAARTDPPSGGLAPNATPTDGTRGRGRQSTRAVSRAPGARLASNLNALSTASCVPAEHRVAFFRALDFSQCGAGSRLAVEGTLIREISGWTHTDVRPLLDVLMRTVRRLMMPEGKGEIITRSDVLAWLGVSDEAALFPCPSDLTPPSQCVPRAVVQEVVDTLIAGRQRVCLHGGGGVGKTTALFEVGALLPKGSQIVTFDCYGGGRYLDAESPRHRPAEAFLQLANDMAAQLRLPLLLTQHATAAMFAKRLALAADALRTTHPDAVLVVAVDAADNAVYAAQRAAPPERAFVQELAQLGDLSVNVRLLITARTSRVEALELRRDFVRIELAPFTEAETATNVGSRWPVAPAAWIEDFHALSRGNPRVQAYAFGIADNAGDPGDDVQTRTARALEALQPSGKSLDTVFADQFAEAVRKSGSQMDAMAIAGGLVALPRPIPVSHLAAVVGRTSAQVREFCEDLAPGIRFEDDAVGFTDEDFESFVRAEAGSIAPLLDRVADQLSLKRSTDAYAAVHVAPALFAAGRRADVIALARDDDPLDVIKDPVARRDVQLQRLRLAMRVCREAENVADALFTVVRGAAALKSEDTIRDTFVQFPDLAARFAERTMSRVVLQRPEELPRHGRLLFHLVAADAERGDQRNVREGRRRITAWLRERHAARRRSEDEDGAEAWPIEAMDIAAAIEAVLRTHGPAAAFAELAGWRPRSVALRVALTLGPRLAAKVDIALLRQCLDELDLSPWDLLLRVPLALSGGPFDAQRVEDSLATLLRRGLVARGTSSLNSQEIEWQNAFHDTILAACELCVAAGHTSPVLDAVLTAFAAPGAPPPYIGDTAALDRRLRAHALLARRANQSLDATQFIPQRTAPANTTSRDAVPSGFPDLDPLDTDGLHARTNQVSREARRQARADEDRDRVLRDFVAPFVSAYDTRARILLGQVDAAEHARFLANAVDAAEREAYRSRHYAATSMRTRAATSLLVLIGQPQVDPLTMWTHAVALAAANPSGFSEDEARMWVRAGARPELHAMLVEYASTRAAAIRRAQTAAPDQVTELATLARVVLPISVRDAEAIYFAALEAVEDVDPDFVHLLTLVARLANRAPSGLDPASRRRMAATFAVVLEDAATRLSGYDGFPWREAVRGLAELDLSFTLAAVGRWDDTALVSLTNILPEVLQVALETGALAPETVVALHPLIGTLPEGMPATIADRTIAAVTADSAADIRRRVTLAETLAEVAVWYESDEVDMSSGRTWDAVETLLAGTPGGPWSQHLQRTVASRLAAKTQPTAGGAPNAPAQLGDESADVPTGGVPSTLPASHTLGISVRPPVDVAALPWSEYDIATADGLTRALKELSRQGPDEPWVPTEMLLRSARARVPVSARTSYLDALVELLENDEVPSYAVADEVLAALNEWSMSAAVEHWCATTFGDRLPDVLPALAGLYLFSGRTFAALCRYAATEPRQRGQLGDVLGPDRRVPGTGPDGTLEATPGAQATRVRNALLLGLERHVDQLSPGAIYSVVERVAEFAAASDIARAADAIVTWCASRVAREHRSEWNLADLTTRPEDSLGRLLYASLGDLNVRARWRAAHAVRRLAASGEHAIVSAVVDQYARHDEALFRDPEAPFYWQAARLWLVIALARVAHASAQDAAPYAGFLVAAGTDPDFPHVLLRAFARDGVAALSAAGVGGASVANITALDAALGAGRPRRRRPDGMRSGRHAHRMDRDSRRFHFDPTDTLPYWYPHAVDVFVDVDMPEFLDAAEHWIVDAWKVTTPVWEWDREPRRSQLGDYAAWSHSHGSRPKVWRFSTHLEWHAMLCAIGALLPTHTLLAATRGDDYDTLEGLLRREALRDPPYWLADIRTPRPLAPWLSPEEARRVDVNDALTETEFRAHAGLDTGGSWVTVASGYEISGPDFHGATTIQTALVTPAHATGLVRALQTVDDAHDFRLPDAGDDFEIRTPHRKLLGWLRRSESDAGLDDDDPLRRGAAGLVVTLPREVAAQLGVHFALDPFPCWADDATGRPILTYETWSNAEPNERMRSYGTTARGWRLQIEPDALQRFLHARGLDLILEVGIHRRSKGYEYERYDEEDPPRDARFSRLYLLRAGGELVTAEGSAGTWQAPGP